MEQHARGSLVNVLCCRDQHDPGVFERDMDRDIIGSVTCQAVNLVHDAIGHVVGFDVLDHPHQFRAVGLPG
ncbi:hypothetical protein HMPREF2128_00235 [Pseudoglutamicibacter albus DNF00011]|uniref:Uncharacterized protein n=1 Tax=Pseudoglutamicibacter albus DNF00011 TaxID=1401063 RepID=A0A095ZTA7_9MICC|nr:hypothetical protein HMPREF2128_00235 [Pseudoglutamicibacter albus DNF00011]